LFIGNIISRNKLFLLLGSYHQCTQKAEAARILLVTCKLPALFLEYPPTGRFLHYDQFSLDLSGY